jgi:hypothetical protein
MLTNREWLPPLVSFELTRAGRAKWYYALRVVPLVVWFAYVQFSQLGPVRFRPDAIELSFVAVWFVIVTSCLVVGPVFGAASFAGERERGTLDILLLAGKSIHQVYWAKLTVVVLAQVCVLAGSYIFMPMLGTTWPSLVLGILAMFVQAYVIAALAVFASAAVSRASHALIATYAIIAIWIGAGNYIHSLGFPGLRDNISFWTVDSSDFSAMAFKIAVGAVFTWLTFVVLRQHKTHQAKFRSSAPRRMSRRQSNSHLKPLMRRVTNDAVTGWVNSSYLRTILVAVALACVVKFVWLATFLAIPVLVFGVATSAAGLYQSTTMETLQTTPLDRKEWAHAYGAAHAHAWLFLMPAIVVGFLDYSYFSAFTWPEGWLGTFTAAAAVVKGVALYWVYAWAAVHATLVTKGMVRMTLMGLVGVLYAHFIIFLLGGILGSLVEGIIAGREIDVIGLAPTWHGYLIDVIVCIALVFALRRRYEKRFAAAFS